MNDKTECSVIVPVYKIDYGLLRRCLDSLHKQTMSNLEIIVVDDGSPDLCGIICDSYKEIDDRFSIIHSANRGVSYARNLGIKQASGKYLMFVDGDDYLQFDACNKVCKAMDENGCDILYFLNSTSTRSCVLNCDEHIYSLNKEEIEKFQLSTMSHVDVIKGVMAGPPWGKVFKRSIIVNNGIHFEIGLNKSQDRLFVFDYLCFVQTAAIYYYDGYCYIDNNPNSVTSRFNPKIAQSLNMALDLFYERIKDNNQSYMWAYNQLVLSFLGVIISLDYLNKFNKDSFIIKKKKIKDICNSRPYKDALLYGNLSVLNRKSRILLLPFKYRLYSFGTIWGQVICWIK